MSSMGLRLESTKKNYKRVKNMWNDFSDNTGAFPKLNNMENNNI